MCVQQSSSCYAKPGHIASNFRSFLYGAGVLKYIMAIKIDHNSKITSIIISKTMRLIAELNWTFTSKVENFDWIQWPDEM